jgi:hypothetical protein
VTTPGFCGLLGLLLSKRFARLRYHPARSSPGFRLTAAYNLGSQSHAPSTGLGQGFRPTSESRIHYCTFHRTLPRLPPYVRKSNPFRTKGRYFLRAPSTEIGQGFHPTIGTEIPSGQRGDISYRQPRSRLLQPHFSGPKEAEGILGG